MQKRAILHSDINCCYAQIECQANPELRDKPVVVGGDEEARHGIVLAKNLLAKKEADRKAAEEAARKAEEARIAAEKAAAERDRMNDPEYQRSKATGSRFGLIGGVQLINDTTVKASIINGIKDQSQGRTFCNS